MSMEIKSGLIVERNGVGIHVHFVENGCVYYQKWPKGVENQGMFDNLGRMPIAEFEAEINAEPGRDA